LSLIIITNHTLHHRHHHHNRHQHQQQQRCSYATKTKCSDGQKYMY